MSSANCTQFGLKLGSLPLINVRSDFNSLLALFRSETFRKQFRGDKGRSIPVKTHYFTWHGRPNTLLTYLLRDAIVGLECAISGAVWFEVASSGRMTPKISEAIKDPFSLRLRGTAECVFNGLPALVDTSYALDKADSALWQEVRTFYREVRNPIFHACEVLDNDPDPVWKSFELIWKIYQWLNAWHPIENLLTGPINWNPEYVKRIKDIPSLDELRVKQIIPERSLPERGTEYLECLSRDMSVLQIEEVEGVAVTEFLDISMRGKEGKSVKVVMSPHAAMRLLAFLALAQKARGWELPDRV
ncbi:hypothetical protein [Trichlorobacter lovleyi]|uniref:hypothetical protein n=1 Tax=Trichlorobacter lovleyi TaxID=313985 RepID=UPI0024818DC6|nr:hypothetical protein [Trichlorobacter lovleyi]